ncbi:MAG: fucose isomerase, partial [Spirochaetaceae bacterium]|nr:fucose isomerase [Spirochaetaceae bacterium]
MRKTTIGLIVGTRGFFPAGLAVSGRKDIIGKLENSGYKVLIPSEDATPHGAVENLQDAKKYARFFKNHDEEIQGLIVTLPNFGDEIGIVETLERAGLNVPVLVHAWDDKTSEMDLAHRRDAFCGKLSVCNNLYQRSIPFTNTTLHTCSIESMEFESDLLRFARICRVVSGLRGARLGAIGQRPNAFNTVRYSEKLLQNSGITVSTVDLSEIISTAQNWEDEKSRQDKLKEIEEYGPVVEGTPSEHIKLTANLSLAVERWIDEMDID